MKFRNPFTREAKASRAGSLLVQVGARQAQFTPRQYDRLADEGYRKNVIAYRAIRLVSQNAAAVPWTLHKGKGRHKARVEDHALLQLLNRPNTMQGGAEMFAAAYGFFLIAGNSYIEGSGTGDTPRELWVLRPDRMRVVPGPQGLPRAYQYTVNGRTIDFDADPLTGQARVLHVKTFHPLDDWYGMSPLEAAAFSIDQHNDAAKWNAALLQSSGKPSGALVYKPPHPDSADILTEEQRQALKAELELFYTGANNAGRPMVLEGGLDWREMSMTPKDMDWLAGKDVSAREIALAFHVPPQLIGIEGAMTYANLEQARLALYEDAVLPLLDHFRDELNNWLAPRFGDDLHIGYDADAIDALAPRREKVWARVTAADFLSTDEKRALLGLSRTGDADA
jgi:HK97 family phage portal protein